MTKSKLPTHIDVFGEKVGLSKDSVILLEQIRTIDKKRLKEKMGHLDDNIMHEVNDAITISFGLGTKTYNEMQDTYDNVATQAFVKDSLAPTHAKPNTILT